MKDNRKITSLEVTYEVTYKIEIAEGLDPEEVAADIGNVLEYQTADEIVSALDGAVLDCRCRNICEARLDIEYEEEDEPDDDEEDDESDEG